MHYIAMDSFQNVIFFLLIKIFDYFNIDDSAIILFQLFTISINQHDFEQDDWVWFI